jgi:hypothetical protein
MRCTVLHCYLRLPPLRRVACCVQPSDAAGALTTACATGEELVSGTSALQDMERALHKGGKKGRGKRPKGGRGKKKKKKPKKRNPDAPAPITRGTGGPDPYCTNGLTSKTVRKIANQPVKLCLHCTARKYRRRYSAQVQTQIQPHGQVCTGPFAWCRHIAHCLAFERPAELRTVWLLNALLNDACITCRGCAPSSVTTHVYVVLYCILLCMQKLDVCFSLSCRAKTVQYEKSCGNRLPKSEWNQCCRSQIIDGGVSCNRNGPPCILDKEK